MRNKNRAFTFIELMTVVTIAGIIFAITTVTYTNISKNSRDARRKADLEAIRQALELCRSYSGSYPSSVVGQGTIICNSVTYMTEVPEDPKSGADYVYSPSGTPPSSYTLSTTLENTGDPDYPTYTVRNP